jgi:ribose/xylose/arabinose/galactoside ABC-type transport system permease subunit
MASITASPASAPSRWSGLRRNIPYLIVYGLIIALMIYGTASSERFLTDRNIQNILRQAVFLGVVALGQTLVILSGGIDLSVGSVVKVSVLVSAIIMSGDSNNIVPAILATLGIGVVVGLVNGLVVTRLKVAPFIVTLGMYSILRGIAYTISTTPVGRAAPEWLLMYDQKIGPVYVLIVVMLVILVALMFMLRRTAFGRHIYAVGGNEQVARLSGISVNRVRLGVYVLCSTLASLTGLFFLSRSGVGDPSVGDNLELQAITAVVIGGTSLFGGRGGLMGTIGGVLLLGLIGNLLVVLNVNQWLRALIEGAIIVIAVALYKQKGRE